VYDIVIFKSWDTKKGGTHSTLTVNIAKIEEVERPSVGFTVC
jgi:hypothetical protein